jgi:hypothetical protein
MKIPFGSLTSLKKIAFGGRTDLKKILYYYPPEYLQKILDYAKDTFDKAPQAQAQEQKRINRNFVSLAKYLRITQDWSIIPILVGNEIKYKFVNPHGMTKNF